MDIISIIFIVVFGIATVATLCWTSYKIKHIKKVDEATEKRNEEIKQENENLLKSYQVHKQNLEFIEEQIKEIEKKKIETINDKIKQEEVLKTIQATLSNQQEGAKKAFEKYCDILDNDYNKKENSLEGVYNKFKTDIQLNFEQYCEELDQDYQAELSKYNKEVLLLQDKYKAEEKLIKEKKDSIIKALEIEENENKKQFSLKYEHQKQENEKKLEQEERECQQRIDGLKKIYLEKESELKNKIKDFENKYKVLERQEKEQEKIKSQKVEFNELEQRDLQYVVNILPKLSIEIKKAIGSIIWEKYYQPKLKKLLIEIMGLGQVTKDIRCGIYKITDQTTNQCYVGQSKNLYTRIPEHIRDYFTKGVAQGGDIDLIKRIDEIGLWNFTFEILEECQEQDLNQKEKFYIERFEAETKGFNRTKGNN